MSSAVFKKEPARQRNRRLVDLEFNFDNWNDQRIVAELRGLIRTLEGDTRSRIAELICGAFESAGVLGDKSRKAAIEFIYDASGMAERNRKARKIIGDNKVSKYSKPNDGVFVSYDDWMIEESASNSNVTKYAGKSFEREFETLKRTDDHYRRNWSES